MGLKSSWLKSLGLKSLGLKWPFKLMGLKIQGLESSWLKSPGLKGLGLKLGVEKSGVEISFNRQISFILNSNKESYTLGITAWTSMQECKTIEVPKP